MTFIFINGKKIEWDHKVASYWELCMAVFKKWMPAVTIQYSKGPDVNPRGTLADMQYAFVKDGMVFVVVLTNKA